ncbi:hypothetical protein [Nocardioides pocheonensis]|uniref:Uncharacterized protein n=1 Tax=Nocardioides pocheonensis TaxID=661485 RepID=A0A3N0GTX5_9ACTN|nr:hypothetical protein [Nocardioides pocheonensis]RNM15917.1 hypothetical protein EFL26_07050 [Nocardioides pocheonensis]
MDETDTGTTTGPEALSAEAARRQAELRRAQARAQFDTPSWLGPARDLDSAPQIPAQPGPLDALDDDDFEDEVAIAVPTPSTHPIPDVAHWSEKAAPRFLAGTVLLLSLAGVLGFLVATILTQSVVSIAGLAACAFVAVVFRGALMSAGVTTVDLKGSIMRVRKGGVLDVVNLADPVHLVELLGTPDQPSWRLHLEAIDGRTIEIGPSEVDAAEVHRIVQYYRAIAERDRRDRERRFNR